MKRKKVLLLNSFFKKRFSKDGRCQTEEGAWLDTFPSVMLPGIAGLIRKSYKVWLLDCVGLKKSLDFFLPQIEKFSPDLTVINTSTSSLEEDLEAGRLIKTLTDSEIALYGEYVTFEYQKILRHFNFVDYIIRGEAETPTLKILEGELGDGIATREHVGNVWREPNLDDLPFPAYDLLPEYRFPLTGERWIFIRSGRGCPYQCIFCTVPSFYGNIPRYHSIEYMIEQIKWVVEKLNIHLGMFWDDTHTLNKVRTIELCKKLIETGLSKKFRYFCTTRADRVDEDVIRYLKLSGCQMIAFGLESGDQQVLDISRKNLKIENVKKAINLARKNNIATVGHFIMGLPGSNIETDKKTIDFANRLKLDFAQFYTATPYSGSELSKMALMNKWINNDSSNSPHVQKDSFLSYPDYNYNQIKIMRKNAFKKFYFNFRRIYSLKTYVRLLKSPISIFNLLKRGKSFISWAFK